MAMAELNLMRLVVGLGQNKLEDRGSRETLSRDHFPDGDNLEDDADEVDEKSNNDGLSALWLDETPEEAGDEYEIDEEISLAGHIIEHHEVWWGGWWWSLTVMGQERRAKEMQMRWRANTDLYFFLSILTMLLRLQSQC